jgi:HicB_like antitoxin of bacterial toxin-antitoxin system
VIEGDGSTTYSAYAPDLPGVIATGGTLEECEAAMREAIEFHIEASGWGTTIRASTFAPALASATQAAHQDASVRAQAKTALVRLEHQEQLSNLDIGQGATTLLTAQGFLPRHPVAVYIDGHKIMTLHADGHGSVSYLIKPSALGLPPGRHVVDLASMLITTTNTFHSS